jgi:hypothetical protein
MSCSQIPTCSANYELTIVTQLTLEDDTLFERLDDAYTKSDMKDVKRIQALLALSVGERSPSPDALNRLTIESEDEVRRS